MNTALSKFMSIALTAVIIAALLFGVGYTMVQGQATGDYQVKTEGINAPVTTAPYDRTKN